MQIISPLIFVAHLSGFDSISTAMELRRFGKIKSGPGILIKAMEMKDYGTILSAIAVLVLVLS